MPAGVGGIWRCLGLCFSWQVEVRMAMRMSLMQYLTCALFLKGEDQTTGSSFLDSKMKPGFSACLLCKSLPHFFFQNGDELVISLLSIEVHVDFAPLWEHHIRNGAGSKPAPSLWGTPELSQRGESESLLSLLCSLCLVFSSSKKSKSWSWETWPQTRVSCIFFLLSLWAMCFETLAAPIMHINQITPGGPRTAVFCWTNQSGNRNVAYCLLWSLSCGFHCLNEHQKKKSLLKWSSI